MTKTALLSVWDKEGLIPLARRLQENGWRLIASGGTARALDEAGINVIPVQEITGQPPLFGGRVKTLHPAIHAGILAPHTASARDELNRQGWMEIDLVVVNLYPFQEAVNDPVADHGQVLEHIDIGGVALMRAAAKNYQRVTVLPGPEDYPASLDVLDKEKYRMEMAHKAFAVTNAYDAAIARYFSEQCQIPVTETFTLYPGQPLRYGENPHQEAAFLSRKPGGSPFNGTLLHGKPLSYNNLLDLEGGWRSVHRFQQPAVAIIKHTSPCGVAVAGEAHQAFKRALASDPTSAFGSVIASNRPIQTPFVDAVGDLFVECIMAPDFSPHALRRLSQNENLRLFQTSQVQAPPGSEYRSIPGGFLRQTPDQGDPEGDSRWHVVSDRSPSDQERKGLRFAWKAVMDVKSNAVLLAKTRGQEQFTVGIGGGQPNRVDCLRMAGQRAGNRAQGAVLASDAFFPFPDGIRLAAEMGVCAVIQPGGSIRDADVIKEANQQGMAMIFTGHRHFRH